MESQLASSVGELATGSQEELPAPPSLLTVTKTIFQDEQAPNYLLHGLLHGKCIFYTLPVLWINDSTSGFFLLDQRAAKM